MDSQKNIIVPVDFGEQSMLALDQSYTMSRMINAEITLLHVIVENSPFWNIFTAKEQEDVVLKFKKKLDDFAKVVSKKSGRNVNTIVEKGKLIDKIIEVCDRTNARFLIVGTVVKDNIREKIIGSNATRLVRETPCPVITIKGKQTMRNCKNIILPLDLTKETRQKVSHAINFGRYFKSTIHAITVANSKDSHLVARLESQLEQVQKFIKQQGVDCVIKFVKAGVSAESNGKQLLDYAYEAGADLMMIMTHQEDVITEQFLGTTAKYIINRSEIPVMSITPKK